MMNESTAYNTSEEFCDEYASGYKIVLEARKNLFISSIFSELIPGILSSLFTHQMYFGVDVTHPVYSVVFSNIVLATILSCCRFLLKLFGAYVVSCVPIIINTLTISCQIFMNSIGWNVVAFLRYYLLVRVKKQNSEADVDMIQLKRIALIIYWGLLIILGVIRSFFVLMPLPEPHEKITRSAFFIILLLAFPITTCIIYYRIDLELKIRKRIADNEDKMNTGSIQMASEKTSSIFNEHASTEHPVLVDKHNTRFARKNTFGPESSSGLKTKTSSSSFPSTKLMCEGSFKVKPTLNLKFRDDIPYGGIYVGVTQEGNKNGNTREPDSVIRSPQCYSSANSNDTRINIKDDLRSTNLPPPFVSGATYITPLPNQVPSNKKKNEMNVLQPGTSRYHGEEDTFSFDDGAKKMEKSSSKCLDVRNKTSLRVGTTAITAIHGHENDISSTIGTTKNHLEQVGENVKYDTIEGPNDSHHQGPELRNDSYEDYDSSKEHKSMLKAILFNFIVNGILFFIFVLSNIISEKNVTVDLIVLISTIISLYSILTPILSAIFCFEVVYAFFLQLITTSYAIMCSFNNRIANILGVQ